MVKTRRPRVVASWLNHNPSVAATLRGFPPKKITGDDANGSKPVAKSRFNFFGFFRIFRWHQFGHIAMLTHAAPKKSGRKPGAPRWVCLVRNYRKMKSLTQSDLANALGINMESVCRIERGGDTSLSVARRIAGYFGVAVEVLWPEVVK